MPWQKCVFALEGIRLLFGISSHILKDAKYFRTISTVNTQVRHTHIFGVMVVVRGGNGELINGGG
jgi:hypothetical protein